MKETTTSPLSDRFVDSVRYAAVVHGRQRRKGTAIPYIGHLLGVASLVIDAGGTEDEAIGAMLHDAAEDQGGVQRLEDIRMRFGKRIADIVEACSDALEADPKDKGPWLERKKRYQDHLRERSDKSVFLISAADKLHNARSMLVDYRVVGDALWERFSRDGGRDRIIWNFRQLIEIYATGPVDIRRRTIVRRLTDVVDELDRESRPAQQD